MTVPASGPPPAPPGSFGAWALRPVTTAHPRSTVALVLGILAVVGLAITGPLAWYYGATTMRAIDREPGRWHGRGPAKAGLVMGIIGTALLVLGMLLLLLIVAGIAVINDFDSGYPS